MSTVPKFEGLFFDSLTPRFPSLSFAVESDGSSTSTASFTASVSAQSSDAEFWNGCEWHFQFHSDRPEEFAVETESILPPGEPNTRRAGFPGSVTVVLPAAVAPVVLHALAADARLTGNINRDGADLRVLTAAV